jgi:hypothetical protein
VIGGSYSGGEAAIDLAGITAHVSLTEFDNQLHADAVLHAKLRGLANVTIVTSALTTEVLGNGERVVGLRYRDRDSPNEDGEEHLVELERIFVQIGLMPVSEWLDGMIALTQRGKIEVDARSASSVPDVCAASNMTTTPNKKIVSHGRRLQGVALRLRSSHSIERLIGRCRDRTAGEEFWTVEHWMAGLPGHNVRLESAGRRAAARPTRLGDAGKWRRYSQASGSSTCRRAWRDR